MQFKIKLDSQIVNFAINSWVRLAQSKRNGMPDLMQPIHGFATRQTNKQQQNNNKKKIILLLLDPHKRSPIGSAQHKRI